ncbi:hypothetical protein C8J56DRAFT_852835 [Mycena floridula]|nr:hypothetical protein C8J56DRAFT_852835 [Mycena floridula]
MHATFFKAIIVSLVLIFSFSIIQGLFPTHISTIDNAPEPLTTEHWMKAMEGIEYVAMTMFGSSHYGFDEAGTRDWAQIVPSGDHTVHMKDHYNDSQVFTVALFHQLKCLEIWRREYMSGNPPSPLAHHCLNYFRQQILCHMDLRLESAKNPLGQSGRQYDMVCRDWSQIYKEAESNRALRG